MPIDWLLAGSLLLLIAGLKVGIERWRAKRAERVMRKTYGKNWR